MTSSDQTSREPAASTEENSSMAAKAADDRLKHLAQRAQDAQSAQDDQSAQDAQSSGFWLVFASTFITIFLAELGDKTQVTTMLISAESQAPIVVFFGAGLALIATSLIGVLLGQWLSNRVSEETLDICAGVLLLLITIGLVSDIVAG
ncbi:MAG: TMEM165/GDT1 family protein [Phormidesmis sp.]